VGAASALFAAVLPHDVGRYTAVPLGLAMIWLGYSLWSLGAPTAAAAGTIPGARRETSIVAPSVDRA
jgi:hypothetical protein